MASKFHLDIVTPDRTFYNDEVEMTVVRTSEGDLGIMNDHISMVAPIKIGKMKIKVDGNTKEAAIAAGFVKIEQGKTTIIVDAAEWPEEIDVRRAEEAKQRAEKRLGDSRENIDLVRAEIALRKAINRLEVVQSSKSR
ncbi:F0F1 ATP synthase subunit epsilon [Clostridium formicaceticum]|uniref:ATP synthase epsilon chain n=1 Tax=Clostridium formicaceticum TaxID=1497 RepID=A0AAC9WFJ1_9CLOT|nr:F0F1 ATP synthase subunit epsilon [Clostridium formicaceticum]AOY75585.1 F0F1 ATP synthase subunit epsilon [Clostridium formicaceticum]ARE85890.1 ATP synthase epsilon chain [Clostridium formicaceticum]